MKLEGIKVVDLSLFLPGPAMTQAMADHGADVVKVEPPGGEPNREIGLKRDGVSVFFANTHRGKRSLVLNLKTTEGVEALLRLAATADVFVESFRPGVVDRLGVGYQAVVARNPRIVYVSISAYGQSGPYRDRPAHDLAVEAMAGVLSVNAGWDDRPWNPAVAAADMLAANLALSGVLMALLRRERTGRGDYLDVAMMDALLAGMPNNLGPPDLIPLCRLPPGPGQQPVRDFLERTFETRTREEWVAWMAGKDIAFAPLKSLREGLDDPHVRDRRMVVEDPRGWEHIGLPLKFSDEPGRIDFALPALGEHSWDILRGLGYTAAELEPMKAEGVF
jgi:crotonobetainyl-CoA:carnitine CoA-transferase CaiB-like acyl-CoA transferase